MNDSIEVLPEGMSCEFAPEAQLYQVNWTVTATSESNTYIRVLFTEQTKLEKLMARIRSWFK